MSVANGQSTESQWMRPILDAQNVEWSGREISLLERALAGTSEAYRVDVLLALLNAGYRPTDETFLIVALFGKIKEVAADVPEALSSSKAEFEALIDRVAESVASQREAFEGFTLAVQRVMESVGERLREQAAVLATDHLATALAAKEAEMRRQIQITIGDVTRAALNTAFTDNRELLDQLKSMSAAAVVAAAPPPAPTTIAVPVPVRLVAKGGFSINGKALVPVALALALGLVAGIEFGHAYPPPAIANAARYGKAVAASRAQMPPEVRAWLNSHVRVDR